MTTSEQRHAMQARASHQLRSTPNHLRPPFPCNVLFYSKVPTIKGFRLIRFEDQETFDNYRIMTVAMVRVVLTVDDLNDVPDDTLRYVYNQLAPNGETLDKTEIPRNELQGLAFGVIHNPGAATPYREERMSASAPPETGNASTKTAAKAAEQKAKAEAKEAAKAQSRAEAAAKRADGVIGTIRTALDTVEGTTANELLDKLVKKFPDRTREGMSSTVKIQFSRLEKSTGRDIINAKIKGRGRVYKFADQGPVQGEVDTEAVSAAAKQAASPSGQLAAGNIPAPSTPATTPAAAAAHAATQPAPATQSKAPANKGAKK